MTAEEGRAEARRRFPELREPALMHPVDAAAAQQRAEEQAREASARNGSRLIRGRDMQAELHRRRSEGRP